MDNLTAVLIIGLAGLIHASFQLSVSVLVLLSGHTIGAARSHSKLLRLSIGFIAGTGVMTLLLLSFLALLFINLLPKLPVLSAWVFSSGLLLGTGLAVWLYYYSKNKGTSLWIPRGAAGYLTSRTKVTKRSAEAFNLGLFSVIGELLFIIGPLIAAALAIVHLPIGWQLVAAAGYVIISLIPLLIIMAILGGGRKISQIQKWRERNKRFIQFAAGGGLIVLAGFIFVNQILAHLPEAGL